MHPSIQTNPLDLTVSISQAKGKALIGDRPAQFDARTGGSRYRIADDVVVVFGPGERVVVQGRQDRVNALLDA